MPPMTPKDFHQSFVKKDYEDWQADPRCIRKAFHVAVSATHLADHFVLYDLIQKNPNLRNNSKKQKKEKLDDFFAQHKNSLPHLAVIKSMANAYKHLYTHTQSNCIASTGAIQDIQLQQPNLSLSSGSKIEITLTDNTKVDFKDAIDSVMEMWRKLIK